MLQSTFVRVGVVQKLLRQSRRRAGNSFMMDRVFHSIHRSEIGTTRADLIISLLKVKLDGPEVLQMSKFRECEELMKMVLKTLIMASFQLACGLLTLL